MSLIERLPVDFERLIVSNATGIGVNRLLVTVDKKISKLTDGLYSEVRNTPLFHYFASLLFYFLNEFIIIAQVFKIKRLLTPNMYTFA